MNQRFLRVIVLWMALSAATAEAQPMLYPAPGATEVNPDTRLKLTFASAPPLGNQGKVRIIDAANDQVADELDLSIPPGPRNNRSPAPYDTLHYDSIPDTVFRVNTPDTDTSHVYQQNHVGGTADSDARHFFPVLIEQNVATIVPHNNRLSYGKTYYVQIDPQAFPFPDGSFKGVTDKTAWTFSTKQAAPAAGASVWVVSADGGGDFDTVQAAIDATPDNSTTPKELFIKSGVYEEIIALRNKQNLTLHGEDRKGVLIRYANNGVFNAVGRGTFSISTSTAINLVNFTIQVLGKDENPAQAEALYVRADKLQVHDVTMLGSGDAMQIQTTTRLYASHSSVRGYGDNLLSYGAAFFRRCDLISTYGPHGWPRNPQGNHGDVFVDSTFSLEGEGTSGDGHCTLARSPSSGSNGSNFPYAEFVLINCKLSGIAPEGWGDAGPDYTNVHFWEYNSVNLSDGSPVDVSKRVSYSRQLTMAKDAETIANYSDPTYVLGGWTPELAPLVLTQPPEDVVLAAGASVELTVEFAAEPAASYQWLKNGQPLPNETSPTLSLSASTPDVVADYTLRAQNSVGMTESHKLSVTIGTATASANAGSNAPQLGAAGATATAGSAAPSAGAAATSTAGTAATSTSTGASVATAASAGAAGQPGQAAASNSGAALVSGEAPRSGGCSLGNDRRAFSDSDLGPALLAIFACLLRRRGR